MTTVFLLTIMVLATLSLAVPTCGFHRRFGVSGCPEFIDLDKYYLLRCQGAKDVSGSFDDLAGIFKYESSVIDFAKNNNLSLAGFRSVHYAPKLIIDLDGNDALTHARTLYRFLTEQWHISKEDITVFFSGNRGIHIFMDMGIVDAEPSTSFYLYLKMFCARIAKEAGVIIDMAVYGPLQVVRSPNAKHPSSGLYKTVLLAKELFDMPWNEIRELGQVPRYFEPQPPSDTVLPELAKLWRDCVAAVDTDMKKRRKVACSSLTVPSKLRAPSCRTVCHPLRNIPKISKKTLNFIKHGAPEGTRHARLVSAAKNFADFGPGAKAVAYALLFPPAFMSGLPEPEIISVIEWAFK